MGSSWDRRLLAGFLLFLCGFFLPTIAFAQPNPDPPPERNDRTVRTDQSARYEIIRGAVRDTGDAYRARRRSDAWNDTASGLLSAGIGGYLLFLSTENDDLFLATLSVTAIGLGVRSLVSGIFNFVFPYSQEPIADKLLSDRELLLSSGMLFLEQEAKRAKRNRIVGGTMSILNAGTYALMYFPLSSYAGDDTTLLAIVLGVGAALELVGGVITLVGKSGPERVYERTKAQIDYQEGNKRLTLDWDPMFAPSLQPDSGWVGGLTFGGTF